MRIFGKAAAGVAFMALAAVSVAQEASTIKEIAVRGLRRVREDVVTNAMRTKVGRPYIQADLDADQRAIEDLGYFAAVSLRPVPLTGGDYQIVVDVEEFPEIKEIQIVGNSSLKTEEILAALTLKPGQVYNLNAAQPSGRAVSDLYDRRGFFARVTDIAPSRDSPGTIVVTILEQRVGDISIQGNRQTKEWIFRRLIRTRTGETFNVEKWQKDLRRIANTQWFEPGSIKTLENTEREPGKIDLTVELREQRTGNFTVGLQLDPQNSLAGVVRLNETNLLGTGQSVGLDLIQTTQGGGSSIGLDYVNPFFRRSDTTLTASIYSRVIFRFNNAFGNNSIFNGQSQYNERRTGGSFGLSRLLTQDLSAGASLRFENVRTNNTNDPSAVANFIQQDGDVAVVTLGGTLDRRDLAQDASRGDYFLVNVEPGFARINQVGGLFADPDLIGTSPFVKGLFEYRRYFTRQPPRGRQDPEAPRRVLAARIRAGTITGRVPFFEQYFAGGANSVRGYNEDQFWGKNLLVTNLEYRYPLQRSFNLIGFVDYGGAWGGYGGTPDFAQSRDFKLRLGYGLGVAFRTPLGPIRLDYGINENGRGITHFLIGTSF